MHIKERVSVSKLSSTAAERHKEDFENLHETIDDYLSQYGCIPYCVVLQLLDMRYLGAGLLDSDFIDKDYRIILTEVQSPFMYVLKPGKSATIKICKESTS